MESGMSTTGGLLIGILAGMFILLAESRLTWRDAAEMAKRQFYWWFHYSP
jgi:hypothetical protein